MRNTLAVLAGLGTMVLVVVGGLYGSFALIGPDRAFRPGSFDVSPLWLVIWLVTSLGAALAGGWFCGLIARGRLAPRFLAGLVFLGGVYSAGCQTPQRNDQRPAEMSHMGAMSRADAPPWADLANPVLGAIGALVGAELVQRRRSKPGPVETIDL